MTGAHFVNLSMLFSLVLFNRAPIQIFVDPEMSVYNEKIQQLLVGQ